MSFCQPEDYNSGDNNAIDMVPRWFEMLKELRNGTISYIQLIKREQIRPPVRPVCRRLGVAKLSDIVSEDILYRAIVQVAESQSQGGGRAPRQDDCNESETSSSGSALGVDMNLNYHRQGQYPSHFMGMNGWNYQQGHQQNQQHSQRLQRHSSDGPLSRGPNNINGHTGHNNRMEPSQVQSSHSKSAYDRQARSSYHGATQQYGTYADLENEMNYMRRQDYHLDNYGGEREVQGFGQQLFSGQSGTQNLGDNFNFHNSHESQRPYSRTEMAFPQKPTTLGNKAFTPMNNRMMQNISGNSDPNIPPLPVRSSNSADPLSYSPQNSPRTPRLGNFNVGGVVGNTSILGSTTVPSRGALNPYSYSGQQVQVLGQAQQQSSGQTDQRLVGERDQNIASRPYASTAHSNAAGIQRSAYGNISSLIGNGNNDGSFNQGSHMSAKQTNQASTAGQNTANLPSPRTTSFMPFGSLNSCATRGLGEFGEFLVGAAGSDFGGSDGFSQQSQDEQASLGDQSANDYYFKGDYTSSMLDPINISREQNMDIIESTLESNIDSDVSIYGYGNRFSYPPKPWESL